MRFNPLFFAFVLFFSFQDPVKEKQEFRIFDESTKDHVKAFYQENHQHQTLAFVLRKKIEYALKVKKRFSIWEAIELVDQIIDESDPDIDLPQHEHFYQTAEALRRDGQPRWLILTGFIHDLGKLLTLYGEPQWAVVGDTFPVGCAYSDKIVFSSYFENNRDMLIPLYQTPYGVYRPHCGFDNLHMSYGHDEYLYQVVKNYLPEEANYIIRFHSFYAAHRENEYRHLMSEKDERLMPWLKLFSQYDLYSKSSERVDVEALKPYYEELVAEFFPQKLDW